MNELKEWFKSYESHEFKDVSIKEFFKNHLKMLKGDNKVEKIKVLHLLLSQDFEETVQIFKLSNLIWLLFISAEE